MKLISKILDRNRSLLFLIVAYILCERMSFLMPFFRDAFKDNSAVSYYWAWFLFQLGLNGWLMVLVTRSPNLTEDIHAFRIRVIIMVLLFIRFSLTLGVLSPAITSGELKPNLQMLWFWFNAGEYKIEFMANLGIPVLLAYIEGLLLIKLLSDRVRNLVDDHYRERFSIETLNHNLHNRTIEKG